jgi:hypothetical protein
MQFAGRAGHLCVWQLSPRLFVGLAVLAGSAWSQTSSSLFSGLPSRFSVCDSGEKTVAPGRLSFKQQACWYANNLAAPSLFLHAGFSSAIGQWHNESYGKAQDDELSYAQRFGVFYARHTARDAAELIAGYLNHEDPRPHTSGESGIWRRTKAALLSVLVLKTDEGSRPALTPIAGALGSALVGSSLSLRGRSLVREASFSYSSAFGTAVCQEFKPDISSLVRHALHRQTN